MPPFVEKMLARMPVSLRKRLVRIYRPRFLYFAIPRTKPISRGFWTDRGHPVDRYFVEKFLAGNARFIRGVCLEVQNPNYARKYGRDLERVDVLDVDSANPQATVIGDLRRLNGVASNVYDCAIITQTLHFIDDLDAAICEIKRVLKPGGTALITSPFLQKLERPEHTDYWRLTPLSMSYLFGKHFASDRMEIRSWGNVLTGTALLVGLAQEDLRTAHLDQNDPQYPCILSMRATKEL